MNRERGIHRGQDVLAGPLRLVHQPAQQRTLIIGVERRQRRGELLLPILIGPAQLLAQAAEESSHGPAFDEILSLIESAKRRTYQAVNTELVTLYWQVGEYISNKLASAEWGDGVVEELARAIARRYPGLRGFTRPNLFRMRQFFEAYRDDPRVSPLVRQLPWTHHLIILSQSKLPEEREFYVRLAIRERWSKRELERQCRARAFHRAVLSPPGSSLF